jgi:hypothetical protein
VRYASGGLKDPLIIANAGGFWGDRNDALFEQVSAGPVDVVMSDYLAEITMSILRRQQKDDPRAGYARDFLAALGPALATVAERGIRVVTNAGGVNPRACAEAVCAMARERGHDGLRVGLVTGDDITDRLDDVLTARERLGDEPLANLDTGAPFATIRERVASAHVYLGAQPIAEALAAGAHVVVTGRTTDSALALGPLIHHFGWAEDDWDRLAAGIVAGHVLECGAQASGGNFMGAWSERGYAEVPNLARVGYPIAEVAADGSMVITKHAALGGVVSAATVKEQLVYEIGDPRAYVTPDVVADFTSIRLRDLGGDRVQLDQIRGRPAPPQLKVSIAYLAGWRNELTLVFVWPHAEERARRAADLVLERCRHLGLVIDGHHVDVLGASPEASEVVLRLAIKSRDRKSAERFGAEAAPLITAGLPGACGAGARGRPSASPIVDFWPALVAKGSIPPPRVEVLTA